MVDILVGHDITCFLKEITGFFVQILMIARQMKLLKLGGVSLDGSKVKANASRHKALSYLMMLIQ
jgi:hypothetical protein